MKVFAKLSTSLIVLVAILFLNERAKAFPYETSNCEWFEGAKSIPKECFTKDKILDKDCVRSLPGLARCYQLWLDDYFPCVFEQDIPSACEPLTKWDGWTMDDLEKCWEEIKIQIGGPEIIERAIKCNKST